jgi:hypothetical protein
MAEQWILPTMVFKLIKGLVNEAKETEETIRKNRQYGKVRESWISAVFLLRKMQVEGNVWYLRKNDLENSVDDIYAQPFVIKNGRVYSSGAIPIQAFQITENSPSLKKAISNKLTNDLRGVSLVGYIMRDDKINWMGLHRWLKKIKPDLRDIHIIANIYSGVFTIVQVYPKLNFIDIGINLCILNAKSIVEPTRVYKEVDSGVTYLGKAKLTSNMDVIKEN